MKFLKYFLILFTLIFISCDDSNNDDINGKGTLSIRLVDEPGDYENVYVEILDVMIKYEDSDSQDDENGWDSVGIVEPGIYDLLELTGGTSLQLVDNEEIESGTIKQIRLILGEENSLVIEGQSESVPLNTPSAQQSGLKVMVNQEVLAGFNYDFVLDFDVDESIVMAGNSGNYNLKPVLRASLEINSGTIIGNVQPSNIIIEIEASNGTETASTFIDSEGNFEIPGLSEGIYTLTITPDNDSMLNVQIIENIEVTIGDVIDVGSITLQ
jgi:hypothetical protein